MTHINLLPWRRSKRENEKKQHRLYLLACVLSASVIVFLLKGCVMRIVHQQSIRNHRLEHEIVQLDRQLKAAKKLKTLHDMLLEKMTIVQHLQSSRTAMVVFLDSLIDIVPSGVVLAKIEQHFNQMTLVGYSESVSQISALMRHIEHHAWIKTSGLPEIHKQGMKNQFKLCVTSGFY